YYDALLSLKVAEVAARERPNLIHAHLHEGALIGWPVAKALGAPLVFDFQGSLTSEMVDHNFLRRDSVLFPPLRRLERVINEMASVVITSSHNAADVLRNEFDLPANRVYTIPDSVDTDLFVPRDQALNDEETADLRRRFGIPPGRKVVVYLGLLAHYQGTLKLLEAAEQLVARGLPVHFLVMGYPGEEDYRQQAARMGLSGHVTFTGKLPYEQAPRMLALGDVAVSPKMSETEGNGKLLNYMAAGLPTIAFNTPVAHEILGDLGLYARTGDVTDLANCMAEMLTEPSAAAALGAKLRQRAVEQFSWDNTGRDLLDIYAMVSR
ncbi:MAG: glycosyltransferase family 4 protein, partial [Chloroflexi bacterium]|nr:glycosyltransferase family 4 protein [Chloroflexota bacterium]